jgi:hypothetical protein
MLSEWTLEGLMSQRANAIAAGLGLYVVLVVAFYAVHRLAFGITGGPYPIWYSMGWEVLDAAKAVVPGVAVGWLCRTGAVRSGAIVGGVGGLVQFLTFFAVGVLNVIPFSGAPGRMILEIVVIVLTSAFTNAAGAAAGVFLHDSNSSMQRA